MLKRTPIRRVSKKRKQALTEYYKRRIRYLNEHPFCQIYIKINGLDEAEVIKNNGWYEAGPTHQKRVPPANQIHHTKKPKQTYLNDESTWLSASDEWHVWVENHKSEARQLGVLQNI